MTAMIRKTTTAMCWALVALFLAPGWGIAQPAAPAKDAALPGNMPMDWDQVPVVTTTAKRGEMCINGIWQFVPMLDPAETAPSGGLAYIHVPGSWQSCQGLPGLASGPAQGPAWSRYGNGMGTWCAWYVRKVKVPQAWAGRAVLLSLQRVSTDAIVYVNGKKCGAITWPSGEVDLTSAVTPGGEDTLWIEVMASGRGPASGFLDPTQVDPKNTHVDSKGLIGDVLLCSRSQGAHITDVFLQPSTRQKQLKVSVELSSAAAGPVHFIAHLMGEKGNEEKTFQADATVPQGAKQTVLLSWPWANSRLWDIQQPNLYTLKLEAKGGGLDDEIAQAFGFREFWTEGRDFFMNGTKLHLRPTSSGSEGYIGPSRLLIDNVIKGSLYAGWNLDTHGPYDPGQRGTVDYRQMWADCADRLGYMQVIAVPSLSGWDEAGRRQWLATIANYMRPYHNHPSVVMWSTNPNRYGYGGLDVDPRCVGSSRGLTSQDYRDNRLAPAQWCIDVLNQADPTRPAFNYSGNIGDVYTSNCYLNFEPLQEREEWLSEWAKSGDRPLMMIEFGTPWSDSLMRGRWGDSSNTEPLMTEYCAIYLGPEAYSLETDRYRGWIARAFRGGQNYQGWPQEPLMVFAPAHQELQVLFIRNTYRSWRMWGISGGMNPWDAGWGWDQYDNKLNSDNIPHGDVRGLPAFKPGDRGTFPQTGIGENLMRPFQPGGVLILPAGTAMMAADGPTLAYIAGPPEAFTAKDHSFLAGQMIRKQVALLNDTRMNQKYTYNWKVTRDVAESASGNGNGELKPGESKLIPFQFTAPVTTDPKAQCVISLETTVGSVKQTDTFAFRIFAKAAPLGMRIAVYDPLGKTTTMLRAMGITATAWNGQGTSPATLVIGREALSGGTPLPFDLEALVRSGGRVLVCTQGPTWFERQGFRVAAQLSRRLYPVAADNPVVRGLDVMDFRDWTGVSTLVDPYPTYPVQDPAWRSPERGWRWGSRGAVSSAMLEKPHLSGWRAILEGEFDLAYSPLIELDYGKGRLTLCTLDLEDHYAADPAAERLGRQLVEYVASAVLAPKSDESVVYVGGADDAALLDQLGLVYSKGKTAGANTHLLIVGADGQVNLTDLRGYLKGGGKLIFLARNDSAGPLGLRLGQVSTFHGSLDVPAWAECRGLSASDLRWRADANAWVVADRSGPLGANALHVGANGLLGRVTFAQGGSALICQVNPRALNADKLTYFRFTRWRELRTLSQLLSNCGAAFRADGDVFAPATAARPLAPLYSADYITDFKIGDDPYRYFRW